MSLHRNATSTTTSPLLLRLTSALLGFGFVALIGIVAATYYVAELSRVGFDEVLAARDTRSVAVDLRNALLAAESSQRGFIFAGNEIYLAPYDTAKSLALRRFARLQNALAADASALPALDRLKYLIREKIVEMDATISLKRKGDDAGVVALVGSNRGKALMDEANVFFTGIILAADDRLTRQVAAQISGFAWLRRITIAGGIAIVVVVALAAFSNLRYTRALTTAKAELEALNSGLEERVAERTLDLARANEEVQRFAYIVTHDLRAPLVNIMGFTSELESGVADFQKIFDNATAVNPPDASLARAKLAATQDLEEAIRFIRSSTRKMDGLISAILRLSRDGRRPLHSERIVISELIGGYASAIRHQLKEVGGEINLNLGVAAIDTDRLALEQIFANILDNAVKYCKRERPLRIDVSAKTVDGTQVAIEIQDNGRGIAAQDLERIFELFRRSGPQDQVGEGIGLAHVRAFVRRLGGDITVKSALDVGTTFRIELPLRPAFAEGTSA